MFDKEKIDSYFNQTEQYETPKKLTKENKHSSLVKKAKLILPSFAAILMGVLLVYPYIVPQVYDIKLEITKPQKGELEKLHITNTTFYINDANNQVNNFTAQSIDETAPGSKLIKLTNPEGIIPQNEQKWTNIKSPIGYYNQKDNTLELSSYVDLFYSEGMNVNIEKITYNFNTGIANSNTPVTAQGILGDLKAQGLTFYKNKGLLIFKGPVNIIINEENTQGK